MKVVIITQGISRVLGPMIQSGHDIVGIIESAPRGYRKLSKLRTLTSTIVRIVRRQKTLQQFCAVRGIPYLLLTNGSNETAKKWMKSLSPDLVVVYSMSQLLTEDIFTIPTLGTINLHTSYLPEYRGPNPDFWQYVNLEMNAGVTVHYVDKGEDTGDIIAQERILIPLGTKSPERLDILVGQVGVRLLLEVLNQFAVGKVKRLSQPVQSPTKRARNIKPEEHSTVIDWNSWTIENIWHVLRGTETWLNALHPPQGILKGQKWVIEDYVQGPSSPAYTAGKIYSENGKRFVACRDGRIYIRPTFKISAFVKMLAQRLQKFFKFQ